MTTNAMLRAGAFPLELYAAAESEELHAVAARLLAEHYGVDRFAVYLRDRRGETFLEHAQPREAAAAAAGWPRLSLAIQDQSFGELRAPGVDALADFACHYAQALYIHKVLTDQNRLIDEGMAHIQALRSMGELLGDLDCDLLLNRILKFNLDLLAADVGAARLYRDDELLLEARWGLPLDVLEELVRCQRDGRRTLEGSLERLRPIAPSGFTLAAALRMPIELRAPHRAELYLVSGEALAVGAHQQELVASCQAIAGIALQTALDHEEQIRQHRLNEQLEVARRIQQQLLPETLPLVPGLEMAGRSLPALYVGGDYYDLIPLPGGALLAMVADVSGKGVQAAIRMSALRAVLRTHMQEGLGPGELLARLNRFLLQDPAKGLFVTALCLLFDEGGRRLRLASAGHEAPLLLDAGGRIRWLPDGGGLPLGIAEDAADAVYPETQLRLRPGERLLAFTDGLADTRDESGSRYGEERLRRTARTHLNSNASLLVEEIFAELEAFRGRTPWSDDLTLLCFNVQAERGS